MEDKKDVQETIGLKGWLSLILFVCLFSGIFNALEGPLQALDVLNLTGKFGTITDGVTEAALNFQGAGGNGAKHGFLIALGLIPGICLAVGIVDVVTELNGMKAAAKLFNPILKPLMGLNGHCGATLVASLNSSDVGSVMTKQLYEDGLITDKQRTIFVAYQYPGSALVFNVINSCGILLPLIPISLGLAIVAIFITKVIGANIVRLIFAVTGKKHIESQSV